LSIGVGYMAAMRNQPHDRGNSARRDVDMVRRTIAELKTLLEEREIRFQQQAIEGMNDFRNRKRRGEIKDDPYGDVFLLIDGWRTFREDFESLEPDVLNLAA